MRVFILGKRDANPFFNEIETHSDTLFDYGSFSQFNSEYEALLIHWPEAIFNWEHIEERNLTQLKNFLDSINKNITIYHCLHNLDSHGSFKEYNKKLYDIVWAATDVFIHLGTYSRFLFEKRFPDRVHKTIHHPLYKKEFTIIEKNKAREQLGIPQNAAVFFIPGKIRTMAERNLVVNGFKQISINNKFLIAHRFYFKPFPISLSNRPRLKKIVNPFVRIFNRIKNSPFKTNQAIIGTKYLNNEAMSIMMAAADTIIVPRLMSLNSGMVYLALTYSKAIVAPLIGNIKEVLELTNNYGFEVNKEKAFVEALEQSIQLGVQYTDVHLSNFEPRRCTQLWDELFKENNN